MPMVLITRRATNQYFCPFLAERYRAIPFKIISAARTIKIQGHQNDLKGNMLLKYPDHIYVLYYHKNNGGSQPVSIHVFISLRFFIAALPVTNVIESTVYAGICNESETSLTFSLKELDMAELNRARVVLAKK